MKQTAVEWLEQRIRVELTYKQDVLFDELFEKAKAMEKEQIKDAYYNGKYNNVSRDTAEQYYNEIFKSE